MKRKTVQTKYDVPVRQAFRWASEQKFCEAEASQKFCSEAQLHGSRRKSYLSAPFFFHLRYEWLVGGRLYMPDQRCELHHKVCDLRIGSYLFLKLQKSPLVSS